MGVRHRLQVPVNDTLVLDAGWWEEVSEDGGMINRIVHPPEKTLFMQLLHYLDTEVTGADFLPTIDNECIAATAVCLRWGSYLAVLSDHSKPIWADARQSSLSRVSDSEMARINIEVSAALAQWIDLLRADRRHYRMLVGRAIRCLPMTRKSIEADQLTAQLLRALAWPPVAEKVLPRTGNDRGKQQRQEAESQPTRVLANAYTNACWRNGPIEDIHAGRPSTYPLLQRRIALPEERRLLRTTASRMAGAIRGVYDLIDEKSERRWPEQVLPFHLVPDLLITPSHWSLHEQTREMRLSGPEPTLTRSGPK